MTDPNLGRLIANRYQTEEIIGKGSMGKVYLAKDILLGDIPVAVKFLAKALLNKKMRDRFRSEARTCAQLGNKNLHIVRVMDYGVDDDEVPFYVMEYLKGSSLNELVKQRDIPLPRFLKLTRQICLGLQCAHREGVIHRDIKPRNILIIEDSSIGEMAKVLDFGIARMMEDGQETTSFMGTLAYASPEQMEGKELDCRSDIYSLGIMMYELLTYKMPLRADAHNFASWYKTHHHQEPRTFEEARPGVKLPKTLAEMVMGCLEKLPENRPQTIAEILKVLEPLEARFDDGRQVGQEIKTQTKSPAPSTKSASKPEKTSQKLRKLTTNKEVPTDQSHQQPGGSRNLPAIAKVTDRIDLSADDICRLMSWPKDKPIAEIVFPHIIPTSREKLPTLWVMMNHQELQSRRYSTRYNQFLCMMSPHPMVMWVTVIYNTERGPRWLPCYLDLKTSQGREIACLLSDKGSYRILMFSTDSPETCSHVMSCTIPEAQCQRLKEWIVNSKAYNANGYAQISKAHLRKGFEDLKPQILAKLEALIESIVLTD